MDYTQNDIDSLADKLAAADLTPGEQAVTNALVDAADDEVVGFTIGFAPLKPAEFMQVRKDSGEVWSVGTAERINRGGDANNRSWDSTRP